MSLSALDDQNMSQAARQAGTVLARAAAASHDQACLKMQHVLLSLCPVRFLAHAIKLPVYFLLLL